MPTATFTFDLSDPDERQEYLRFAHSLDMASALYDIVNNTRKSMFYQVESEISKNADFTSFDAVDLVMDRIIDIINEHSIDINKLID
jgi:hypothetical protein